MMEIKNINKILGEMIDKESVINESESPIEYKRTLVKQYRDILHACETLDKYKLTDLVDASPAEQEFIMDCIRIATEQLATLGFEVGIAQRR
jgi:hypothetical protein